MSVISSDALLREQLIETSFSPRWLPPRHHWHSGLVPVPRWVVARRPDMRWFGGSIPLISQLVIAAFIWTYGHYHAG